MSLGQYSQFPYRWDGTRRITPGDWDDLVDNLTGSQIKTGSFAVVGPVYITGSLILSGSNNLSATNVNVQQNGVVFATTNMLNFVSGSATTVTVVNDTANNRADITFDLPNLGGGNIIVSSGSYLTVLSGSITQPFGSASLGTLIVPTLQVTGSMTVGTTANIAGSLTAGSIGGGATTIANLTSTGSTVLQGLTAGVSTLASSTFSGSIVINSGSNLTIQSGSIFLGTTPQIYNTGSILVLSGSLAIPNKIVQHGKIVTTIPSGSLIQVLSKYGTPVDADFNNPADGLVVVDTSANKFWMRSSGNWTFVSGSTTGSATSAYNTVQNAGVSLTQRNTINFLGSGVTAVDNAGSSRTDVRVDITGSYIFSGSNIGFNSGSNVLIQSGSIAPFSYPASYVIFSGSVTGWSGSYFALNGSNNEIVLGSSDPTNVINTALTNTMNAGGGLVFVNAGVYNLTGSLIVGSKTIFEGAGWGTVIRNGNGVASDIIQNYGLTHPVQSDDGIVIQNMTLDGNNTVAIGGLCIDCSNIVRPKIINCNLINASAGGILIQSAANGIIAYNRFYNSVGIPLFVFADNSMDLIANNIFFSQNDGIVVAGGSYDIKIINGTINQNQGHGININGSDQIMVSDVTANANGSSGIIVQNSVPGTNTRFSIKGCTIKDNGGNDGIEIDASNPGSTVYYGSIIGNILTSNSPYGILAQNLAGGVVDKIIIMGNTIQGAFVSPIVAPSPNNQIVGNITT
jgi:hypothetical protein